jgi:hypothetical protein
LKRALYANEREFSGLWFYGLQTTDGFVVSLGSAQRIDSSRNLHELSPENFDRCGCRLGGGGPYSGYSPLSTQGRCQSLPR